MGVTGWGGRQALGPERLAGELDAVRGAHEGRAAAAYNDDATYEALLHEALETKVPQHPHFLPMPLRDRSVTSP